MQVKKAFTLVELMVAMGIIGILVTLSLLGITIVQRSQRDVQRKASLSSLNLEMVEYYTENRTYPNNITLAQNSITIGDRTVTLSGPSVPCSAGEAGPDRVSSTVCTVYCYQLTTGSTYKLGINLEAGGWGTTNRAGNQVGNAGICNDAQAIFRPN
jgi:prepilin-type N-terminal cleavage/methylation domain-containing protein